MPNHDIQKWSGPATAAEVAKSLIRVKGMLTLLHNAVVAQRNGDINASDGFLKQYRSIDKELSDLIDEIAGFDTSEGK